MLHPQTVRSPAIIQQEVRSSISHIFTGIFPLKCCISHNDNNLVCQICIFTVQRPQTEEHFSTHLTLRTLVLVNKEKNWNQTLNVSLMDWSQKVQNMLCSPWFCEWSAIESVPTVSYRISFLLFQKHIHVRNGICDIQRSISVAYR